MKNNSTKTKISRKTFLKTSALAGAFVSISGTMACSGAKTEVKEEFKRLRFLFQGDSITDGNRGRNEDPNHIMGHGYAFSVASRIGADFPSSGFTFYNRGISGDTVTKLEKRWQNDTIDLKPDVLSLLVGINDVGDIVRQLGEPKTLSEFESGYRRLLDLSRTQNPDILFVLGVPFVYRVGKRNENWELWNKETQDRAEVVRKISKEYAAVCVEYPRVFEQATIHTPIDYWIWDGVHPTVFGHELMAREWIKTVAERLDFLNRYNYDS
ncbi:SGNH/GDSL hydrolase family protein [Maribellus sediminis]|uniref:SGNH/GDSL hydrolase family protein n=1 Tax=Maribellus sediminis TaxID=2696285 RepID=UPI001431F0E5|nr:SGNH/GDSL hydrolase family protein [Maribellus sediminis]